MNGIYINGRDFRSGGAKYNYHESMAMGIPNVADSLAAIQKLVFEEQKFTLKELMACRSRRENFSYV